MVDLRSMTADVETSSKNELDIIRINVDITFEDEYLQLDGTLTSIYKLQRLGKDFEDSDTDSDLDQPEAQPKKLRKNVITAGKATGRTGFSYPVVKSSDTELDTFENNNEEEGDVGKRVEGKKLAAVVAEMGEEHAFNCK